MLTRDLSQESRHSSTTGQLLTYVPVNSKETLWWWHCSYSQCHPGTATVTVTGAIQLLDTRSIGTETPGVAFIFYLVLMTLNRNSHLWLRAVMLEGAGQLLGYETASQSPAEKSSTNSRHAGGDEISWSEKPDKNAEPPSFCGWSQISSLSERLSDKVIITVRKHSFALPR